MRRILTATVLLLSAGVLTALPLIWFAEGARRLRLSTMGFLQYLAPTGQFLLAVLAYHEPFSSTKLLAFGLISGRIERTVITPPMVFVAFGLLIGPVGLGVINVDPPAW